jgi:V/A-type H+-transporting ATPase subunit B
LRKPKRKSGYFYVIGQGKCRMQRIYTHIHQIIGDVITVEAENVGNTELAQVITTRGTSLAQVIRLDGKQVFLQVFAGSRGISTGDRVRFLGHPMRIATGNMLVGRIFNGSGIPLDNGPELSENLVDIGGPPVNPVKRIIPNKMIRTGIPMIDVFNSLVESQKLPIFSIAGEPYNELLARIGTQAEVDIIILGGMGLKYDDYLFFRDTLEEHGALSHSIVFMHTAADPVVECLLVPDISLAVAENFALEGKRVLVLLTDMSNYCDALKEIAITMQQIPSNRGVIEPFGSLSRLKQLVNSKTRDDHRTLMDTMIQLFADYRETQEKQAMGFQMSTWDMKLLKYGHLFEDKMMSLKVNIPLEKALDLGWEILHDCFSPEETGIMKSMIDQYWLNNHEN